MTNRSTSIKQWLHENWKWVIGVVLIPIILGVLAIVLPPVITGGDETPPSDFSMSVNPLTGTVNEGGSIPLTIDVEYQNGYNKEIMLSSSGESAGIIVSFDQRTITSDHTKATITVNVAADVSPNTYEIRFLGRGSDGKEHSLVYTLVVTPQSRGNPSFSVSVTSTQGSAVQGQSVQATITITRNNGYTKDVSLSVSGQPTGAQVAFNPSTVKNPQTTSTMTINIGKDTPTGEYNLTVKGTGEGTSDQTTSFTLNVTSTVSQPTVNITSPTNDATVSNTTTVIGTAKDIPSGHVIWPVVYISSVGRYYPMSTAVTVSSSGSWQVTIPIGGQNDTGQPFDIIMVIANQAGRDALVAYNQDVEKNHPGDYPGMVQLPAGITEGDKVTVIRGP